MITTPRSGRSEPPSTSSASESGPGSWFGIGNSIAGRSSRLVSRSRRLISSMTKASSMVSPPSKSANSVPELLCFLRSPLSDLKCSAGHAHTYTPIQHPERTHVALGTSVTPRRCVGQGSADALRLSSSTRRLSHGFRSSPAHTDLYPNGFTRARVPGDALPFLYSDRRRSYDGALADTPDDQSVRPPLPRARPSALALNACIARGSWTRVSSSLTRSTIDCGMRGGLEIWISTV